MEYGQSGELWSASIEGMLPIPMATPDHTRYLSVLMESLVFRVFSHPSPRESTVDSYPIFKLAGMTTVFLI
jgi:hypothetical protein